MDDPFVIYPTLLRECSSGVIDLVFTNLYPKTNYCYCFKKNMNKDYDSDDNKNSNSHCIDRINDKSSSSSSSSSIGSRKNNNDNNNNNNNNNNHNDNNNDNNNNTSIDIHNHNSRKNNNNNNNNNNNRHIDNENLYTHLCIIHSDGQVEILGAVLLGNILIGDEHILRTQQYGNAYFNDSSNTTKIRREIEGEVEKEMKMNKGIGNFNSDEKVKEYEMYANKKEMINSDFEDDNNNNDNNDNRSNSNNDNNDNNRSNNNDDYIEKCNRNLFEDIKRNGMKSHYVGCYKLKKEQYGNIIFLKIYDGVLYGSVLCPFNGNDIENINPYKSLITNKIKTGGERDKMIGVFDNNDKILLSSDYRLTCSSCPYILSCNIMTNFDEINGEEELITETGKDEKDERNEKGHVENKTIDENRKKTMKNKIMNYNYLKIENNGLRLSLFDSSNGSSNKIFLPFLFNCNDAETDVVLVLRNMCGFPTDTTSFSTSSLESDTFNKNISVDNHDNNNDAYNNNSNNDNNNNKNNNNNNDMSHQKTAYLDNVPFTQLQINDILSSLDLSVSCERNTIEEVRTLDLEILQIVSLISLLEGNKSERLIDFCLYISTSFSADDDNYYYNCYHLFCFYL